MGEWCWLWLSAAPGGTLGYWPWLGASPSGARWYLPSLLFRDRCKSSEQSTALESHGCQLQPDVREGVQDMGHLLGRGCPSHGRWPGLWALLPRSHLGQPPPPTPPRGPCSGLLTCALIGPFSLSSIVLMASKGRYVSRGPWTRVLEKLGADKGFKLKGEGFGLGFLSPDARGAGAPAWAETSSFPQTWHSLSFQLGKDA